jgi:hypothetical protein
MRSLLFVVLVACGSSPPPKPSVDPAVPAADPAPCTEVAANVVKFIDPGMPTDKVGELIVRHCRDDKWSVDLRKCIVTGKTEKDLDPCEKDFVGTQIEDFKRDLEKLEPPHRDEAAPPVPPGGSDVPPAANPMPK